MVAYTDVPKTNALYEEQARVTAAIDLLDSGGTVSMLTIVPPPPTEESFSPTMMMPVTIATVAPSQELLDQVRVALVTRSNEITAELQTLGVTESPPAVV